MQVDARDRSNASVSRVPGVDGSRSEVVKLRALCRRQAWVMDTLTAVIGTLRGGARALRAENAELRARGGRSSRYPRSAQHVGAASGGEIVERRLRLGVDAPRLARVFVAEALGERVGADALERARLVISELVTNSVRHSGARGGGGVVVRVARGRGGVWLEVEDSGRGAGVSGDPTAGGGFGLGIVDALSERWCVEHAARAGTRVWAQLRDAPAAAAVGPGRGLVSAGRGREGDLHVVPEQRAGTWSVCEGPASEPLSEHTSETDAEAAAQVLARVRGVEHVVIHDRYHRTHLSAARERRAARRD